MPANISSSQPENLRRYADLLAVHCDAAAATGRQLDDALGRMAAGCREYALGGVTSLSGRLQPLARRNVEQAGWVRGVADAFTHADAAAIAAPDRGIDRMLSHLAGTVAGAIEGWPSQIGRGTQRALGVGRAAARATDRAAWDAVAARLLKALRRIDARGRVVINSVDLSELLGSLLAIGGIIAMEQGAEWKLGELRNAGDLLDLLEQGFWNLAFHKVSPGLLLELGAEIEALDRRVAADYGGGANSRPPELTEADLTPEQVFVGAVPDQASGLLALPAAAMMAGDHGAISPYQGEQVSLFRIGEREYLFAICGLDLKNMANSPNGMYAVMQTAYESDPLENAYYRLVRERFLSYLAQIPPGSTLNIAGHSMGGGMTMLLLNDPDIQAHLLAGGYTLASATMYGAVRPTDPRRDGVPPSEPGALAADLFADTEVRYYIDPEDRLAMNVGAGHLDTAGLPMPNVTFVDDGALSGGVEAHTSYEHAEKYADLPPELRDLPFQVDRRYWEHYRTP